VADYTVDDSMAKIIYSLSDREIYNDVRAELGFLTTETIVDADPAYEWKYWSKYTGLPAPGYTTFQYFTATLAEALAWSLYDHDAFDYDRNPYHDYEINLIDTNDDETKAAEIKNTGTKYGTISYKVKYKYLASDEITHEEQSFNTLNVRATDETSIRKYGRRVLPLVWPQGTTAEDMQMIVNAALARYKEPMDHLQVTMQGRTDAIAIQIFTREISDTIAVTCANLGLAAVDFYLDSMSNKDTQPAAAGPHLFCTWGLIAQRTEEATGWFTIDTDSLDGPKLLG